MYRLNNRISGSQSNQAEPPKPILAAKRRRQLYPFLFSMGPVALCICSVFLIGLMAVLYLSQLGQAVSANQQLQDLHTEQATLQRQNQDLVNTIAQEQSPDYIATKAKAMGLVQPDPKTVQVLIVKRLELIQENDPSIQP
ncbi:MAG TPA: septum formation initiator family protein [Ktedonobacteraceae bacterium]|nr:septum formation initiator family protein [Ktedonobacteraceae bacterium]